MMILPFFVFSSLGTAFRENSLISTFNELALFTGMSNLADSCFRQASIKEVIFPTSIRTITYGNQFLRCTGILRMDVPEGVTSITSIQWIWGASNMQLLVLPSTVTNLGAWAVATGSSNDYLVVVCNAITPPSKETTSYYRNVKYVYVPDDSVEVYEAATGWSQYAGRIKPLSEFVED